jgi:hypothetical protein
MDTFNKALLIILALSALILSLSFAFSQYVRVKEHNLAVISQIKQCADKNLSDEAQEDCSKLIQKEYIFTYPLN